VNQLREVGFLDERFGGRKEQVQALNLLEHEVFVLEIRLLKALG